MISLIRAIASLPRRWTCEACGDRFHFVQHKAMHIETNHCGDTLPKGHR